MEYEELKKDCEAGLSTYAIAKKSNKSQTNVRRWLNIYKLKTDHQITRKRTNFITEEGKLKKLIERLAKYDWVEIQKFHNDGAGWREISKKFEINQEKLAQAQKLGLFISRDKIAAQQNSLKKPHTYKHSKESKEKISKARKEYLLKTNKPSWKTHDKFKSQPCEWLKSELKKRNIKFKEELQPLLHIKRFFSLDIAFPEQKFAIEINGGQHYDTDGNLKPYYQNRHDLISTHGWDIWEVKYHETRSPLFLERVLEKLKEKMVLLVGNAPTFGAHLARSTL